MNPTLYDILGVAPDASREEIRKAWREAADRFEPGEGGSTKQFRLFNEAAEVLLDPERRKEYDAAQLDRDGEAAAEGEQAAAGGVNLSKAPEAPDAAPAEASDDATEDATGEAPEAVPGPPMPGAARAATPPVADGKPPSAAEPAATHVEPNTAQTPPPITPDRAPGSSAVVGGSDGEAAGRTVPWPVLAVLGVVTAVAVGFAAYFITQAQRAEDYKDSLNRAPAAAESAASAVLSYHYDSLDADRDAAAKYLSEGYRKDYVGTFDKLVSDTATQTKAKVDAQVLASSAMVGGGQRNPDKVPVLLFVNQTRTSTANSGKPAVFLNRVRFDMVRVDGTWLVDGITSY